MKIMDDNFDDYFEEGSVPKPKKTNVETPEQRQERELRESTIDRRYDRRKILLISLAAILAFIVFWWLGSRYFSVEYTSEERGCVMQMKAQGKLFMTYEGVMMSQRAYEDTVLYREDFLFTVRDSTVAKKLGTLAGTGRKVLLKYDYYRGTLPWRGESNNVVTDVKILD